MKSPETPITPEIESPETRIEVSDGTVFIATYYNTSLYFFPNYPFMDHICVQSEEKGKGVIIYDNDHQVMQRMFSHGYPSVINPIPPPSEFESYVHYENRRLEAELSDL